MKLITFLFLFIVLTLSCFSREGLLETEDTVGSRNGSIQRYNEALIIFAANRCWGLNNENAIICSYAAFTLSGTDRYGCDGAYFAYPWTNTDRCIGK